MRRQGLVWLSAAVLALVAAACFSDPTKSLRAGATRLSLAQNTLLLHTGDSASVQALVYDDQGNQLTLTGATWTSTDATIATVHPDTANPIPGDAFGRGVVKAVAAGGGITTVVLAYGSLTDTLRVTVLPAVFPGVVTVTGTLGADTIIAPPAPTIIVNAGDTLTVNSTALLTFSPTSSAIQFGPDAGYILSRSATQIKAMARRAYQGAATITNLTFAGNAATGPIAVASINTNTVTLHQTRFSGVINVAGDTITLTASGGSTFGATTGIVFTGVAGDTSKPASKATVFSQTATTLRAIAPILHLATFTGGFTVTNLGIGAITADSARSNASVTMNRATFPGTATVSPDTLIVTPSANTTFNTSGSKTAVKFGSASGIVFVLTSGQLKVLANANYTGGVTVTNVLLGTARIDSLKTTGSISINKAVYPGAVSNGSGRLLDTVVVASTASAKFTASGASASNVTLGGQRALVISRTVDTMKVISVVGSSSGLTVSNVVVGTSTIPSLTTASAVAVSTATTGEANEPGNNAYATATSLAFTGAADTISVFGSVDCEDDGTACPGNGDAVDYYTYTLGTTNTLVSKISWFGTGSGGNPYGVDHTNPDLDVVICAGTSGACSYGKDITGFSGAGTSQPEIATTTAAQAAGTYYTKVYSYSTPSPIAYRLQIWRQ